MKVSFKRKISVVVVAILVMLGCIISTSSVKADGGVGLRMSPTDEQVTLQPGDSYTSSVKITLTGGNSESDFNYKASVSPFSVDGDNYQALNYSAKGSYNEIVDWITISNPTGAIKEGETVEVRFTINVPKDATPGGQYAAIILGSGDGARQTNGNVAVQSEYRMAYNIYATVAGDLKQTGSILDNHIDTFFLNPEIRATSTIENTGNVHANAEYTLKIFPLFSNEEVYTNEENPATWVIMPGTKRFISQTWNGIDDQPEVPMVGIFRAEQTVKIFGETSTTSKIVVVCPMWLLLVIVFVIVFIVTWLIMRSKNRKAAAKGKGKSSSNSSSTHAATSEKLEKSDKPEPKPDTE